MKCEPPKERGVIFLNIIGIGTFSPFLAPTLRHVKLDMLGSIAPKKIYLSRINIEALAVKPAGAFCCPESEKKAAALCGQFAHTISAIHDPVNLKRNP